MPTIVTQLRVNLGFLAEEIVYSISYRMLTDSVIMTYSEFKESQKDANDHDPHHDDDEDKSCRKFSEYSFEFFMQKRRNPIRTLNTLILSPHQLAHFSFM